MLVDNNGNGSVSHCEKCFMHYESFSFGIHSIWTGPEGKIVSSVSQFQKEKYHHLAKTRENSALSRRTYQRDR
jgi:protein-arginine kinase activator protein McsA